VAPGNLVRLAETHFGVGDKGKTYVLHPGMNGLIVKNYHDIGTILLFVVGTLIEVQAAAVEFLNERN